MSVYVFQALNRYHIRPREFIDMSREEQAFIIASIQIEAESEQKNMRKMKKR